MAGTNKRCGTCRWWDEKASQFQFWGQCHNKRSLYYMIALADMDCCPKYEPLTPAASPGEVGSDDQLKKPNQGE